MHEQDNAVPANGPGPSRQCSRCGATKPVSAFYANPSTVCRDCHNKASKFTGACRRAAIAHLVSAHIAEYRALLVAERRHRQAGSDVASGGDSHAA
jgi:hypothetical protein